MQTECIDLARLLKKFGRPFPTDRVVAWACQLLDVLEYLHSHRPSVIHRDIKPQNLKLGDDERIVLLDFGLAKGEPKLFESASASSIFGFTINYAPLEQIEHKGTDARSDIYSTGATLYQLLTARVPPGSLSRAAAIVRDEPDPLVPIDLINPLVSPEIAGIVNVSMALKPDDRYSTAAEMRSAFAESLGRPSIGHPVFGRLAGLPEKSPESPPMYASYETTPLRPTARVRTQLVVEPSMDAALELIAGRSEPVASETDRALDGDADPWTCR